MGRKNLKSKNSKDKKGGAFFADVCFFWNEVSPQKPLSSSNLLTASAKKGIIKSDETHVFCLSVRKERQG